jgi:uncharacterized membrane protein YgdD (TMEM256/DUF423 family)
MSSRTMIGLGAFLMGIGVWLGAYGAHGLDKALEKRLADPAAVERELQNHETAVRYQMYHAIGLILVGLVAARDNCTCYSVSAWALLIGIALFSGLLYAMVFGGPRYLGAIVPIGGVAMSVGWVALGWGAWRARPD